MSDEAIICTDCGQGIQSTVHHPQRELELSCVTYTATFSAENYHMDDLPPESKLPDEWQKIDI
jgi:hypothetical protein